jgi:hypothetical protein
LEAEAPLSKPPADVADAASLRAVDGAGSLEAAPACAVSKENSSGWAVLLAAVRSGLLFVRTWGRGPGLGLGLGVL